MTFKGFFFDSTSTSNENSDPDNNHDNIESIQTTEIGKRKISSSETIPDDDNEETSSTIDPVVLDIGFDSVVADLLLPSKEKSTELRILMYFFSLLLSALLLLTIGAALVDAERKWKEKKNDF
ncbi:3071_t:CDS:2 [Entrophospora sp. SA101]|nr:3071_t:CDS:2 [Entrophospora sp. SA101]